MARWTDDDPGVFWSGSTSGDNDSLATRLETIGEVRDRFESVAAQLPETTWSGASADAWRDGVDSVLGRIDGLRTTLEPVVAGISTYVDTAAQIANEATYWKQQLADAVRRQHEDVDSSGILGPTVEEVERHRQQQDAARGDAADARRQIEQLAQRRSEADSALNSVIRSALPSTWADQRAALAAVGIRDVDDLRTADIRQIMQEIAQEIADGGQPDADELAALEAYLDLYGDDETQMSAFFLGLGGAGTAAFLAALGDRLFEMNPALSREQARRLAEAWRQALSVGSASWSPSQATGFAESMITGSATGTEIAYLFGDPDGAPMGEQFALAAAIAADEFVRVDGGSWAENDGTYQLFDDPENARTDPVGAIFSTLGRYPDSALGFLSDSGSESYRGGRIEYWYGAAEWPESEHWQGAADLWLGAMGATTAPPGAGSAAEAQAGISGAILSSLAGNGSFSQVTLNEQAAATFAAAIAFNLPGLMEGAVLGAEYSGEPGDWDYAAWVHAGADPFAADGTVFIPGVTKAELSAVLGDLSNFDTATLIISDGTQFYVSAITEAAGAPTAGQAPQAALLERIVSAQALLDGAGITERIAAAQGQDVYSQVALNGVVAVASSYPATSWVGAGAGIMARWGENLVRGALVGAAGDLGSGLVTDFFGTHESELLSQYWGTERPERIELAQVQASTALFEYVATSTGLPDGQPIVLNTGETVPPPPEFDALSPDREAALAEYASATSEWFEANSGAIGTFYQQYSGDNSTLEQVAGLYEDRVNVDEGRP